MSCRASLVAVSLAGLALALVPAACDSKRPSTLGSPPPAPLLAQRPPAAVAQPEPPRTPADAGRAPARAAEPAETEPALPDATHEQGVKSGRWVIDGLADVARAGPATASEHGVVMFNRRNQLWLAALGAVPRSGSKAAPTPIGTVPGHAGPFPLAHGPAVRKGFAYWASQGQLLRQRLSAAGSGAAPEVLAHDGRAGARVSVPSGKPELAARLPHLAAYIAGKDDTEQPLSAKLWVEGADATLTLTEDGGSAHSVALVAGAGGVFALMLEARTGMSPLHLRRIDLSNPKLPLLGEDRIAWVAGSSRPTTEILALGVDREQATGLIAVERDITHFGLARLSLALDSSEPAPDPAWANYKNGIEPAPFSVTEVCGQAVSVLARPTSSDPDSPQELVWLPMADAGAAEGLVLGRSRAFFEVSLGPLPGAALLTYVADRRTWARTIRCVPQP